MKIQRILKTVTLVLTVCLCVCGITARASDTDVEDTSDSESDVSSGIGIVDIDLTAFADENVRFGGTLGLYKVADVEGNVFIYTEDFSGCDGELLTENEISLAVTADIFDAYTEEHDIRTLNTVPVSEDGKAEFTNLSDGLYLIRQEMTEDDCACINAFLVSVPLTENGELIYEINATPKISVTEAEESKEQNPDDETPTETVTEDETTEIITTNVTNVSGEGPKTGDAVNMFGIILMIIAIVSGACLAVYRRRCAK